MALTFNCPKCATLLEADDSVSGGGVVGCPHCGGTVLLPAVGVYPGLDIGGFLVERKLGQGGMGEVWLATQTKMDRKVALKILPAALAADNDFAARFLSEVRVSAKRKRNLRGTGVLAAVDTPKIVAALGKYSY